jgi:hypothetical protein
MFYHLQDVIPEYTLFYQSSIIIYMCLFHTPQGFLKERKKKERTKKKGKVADAT